MSAFNGARLGAIVRKEFIQMSRDRTTLGMLLGIPIFQLVLFGYAIRQDVRNLPTVAYDASRTQESRSLIQQFEATGNFRMLGQVDSYTGAIRTVQAVLPIIRQQVGRRFTLRVHAVLPEIPGRASR